MIERMNHCQLYVCMPIHIYVYLHKYVLIYEDFPGSSAVKNPPANAGDMDLISWSDRFPGGEDGNPLLYSYLGNPMDRGTWGATVCGVAKSLTGLSN